MAVKVLAGDVLQVTCSYDSSKRGRVTDEGWRHTDEMCNFYLMYATKRPGDFHCGLCAHHNLQVKPLESIRAQIVLVSLKMRGPVMMRMTFHSVKTLKSRTTPRIMP